MKNATLARLCLLLIASAIAICFARSCPAQGLPPLVPDLRQQVFALNSQLTTTQTQLTLARDSLTRARMIRMETKREQALIDSARIVRIDRLSADMGVAVARAAILATENETLQRQLAAYRPRTWAGRQLRKVWNGAAYVGIGTVGYVVLRALVF